MLSHNSLLQLRCQRVQCLRIGNAEIPNDKRLKFALQRIHGIGRQRAHQILTDLSIENKLAKDLTGVEIHSLRDEISKYMTGEELVLSLTLFPYSTMHCFHMSSSH